MEIRELINHNNDSNIPFRKSLLSFLFLKSSFKFERQFFFLEHGKFLFKLSSRSKLNFNENPFVRNILSRLVNLFQERFRGLAENKIIIINVFINFCTLVYDYNNKIAEAKHSD